MDEDKFVIRQLNGSDLPFLVALEESSFPPNEAATPEKVICEGQVIGDHVSAQDVSRIDARTVP
jgi:hypothetical protein